MNNQFEWEINMLNPNRLAISGGILWGMLLFIITLANISTGYAPMWVALMADIYPGYHASYIGSLLGLVYGFADGFLGLYLLAWLYNKIGE